MVPMYILFFLIIPPPPRSTLFPYTTLFRSCDCLAASACCVGGVSIVCRGYCQGSRGIQWRRSEEHTSELQSLRHLVCRLLLEKKKTGNVDPSRWWDRARRNHARGDRRGSSK